MGLETCEHLHPSTLDHQTITKSGILPTEFLKGIGWPDWQIAAAKLCFPDLKSKELFDIAENIIQHYSSPTMKLFISYSQKDADFANYIEHRLDNDRIRFWRDIHHMSSGPIDKSIENAINEMGTVLLILSQNSIGSDWVESEARKARKLEKEGKHHVLCPIALDDSWKTCDWPDWLMNQITKYNILDFTGWDTDTDKFEKQYARLKEGLYRYYQSE